MWAPSSETNNLLAPGSPARPGTLDSNNSPFPPKSKRRERRKEGGNGRRGKSRSKEGNWETPNAEKLGISSAWRRQSL